MRIFLAGGAGVIGRRLIPALVASGCHVTATTRRSETAPCLQMLGANAAIVDVYDAVPRCPVTPARWVRGRAARRARNMGLGQLGVKQPRCALERLLVAWNRRPSALSIPAAYIDEQINSECQHRKAQKHEAVDEEVEPEPAWVPKC